MDVKKQAVRPAGHAGAAAGFSRAAVVDNLKDSPETPQPQAMKHPSTKFVYGCVFYECCDAISSSQSSIHTSYQLLGNRWWLA